MWEKQVKGNLAIEEKQQRVIVIEAREKPQDIKLRVAAYARVSSDSNDQFNSFAAQNSYYTTLIASKESWATVDCLHYIRMLRELGIAVIFEKENINTLEADSEMLITILGAFAQAESESISGNVQWGKRQAARDGKAVIQYKRLYGYRRGENNKPEIIPEQAEVVWRIYDQYLAGASLPMIKAMLESEQIPNVRGNPTWSLTAIRGILTNEKYHGDVLIQKTFVSDCISKKTIRNTGQLPMYLLPDHHEGIIDRHIFDAVQTEMARRNAGRSPSKKNAPTGRTSYASKYALSERLVCGECGTLYRRCVWAKKGRKRIVWRCVSRLDYGTKYCHDSPTLDEEPLQRAILTAVNKVMSNRSDLAQRITSTIELQLALIPGQTISLVDIQHRLDELERQFNTLLGQVAEQTNGEEYMGQFQALTSEITSLKEQRRQIEEQRRCNTAAKQKLDMVADLLKKSSPELITWNESVIRQLVDTVKVLSANQITVYLRDGIEITQDIIS